jgi:hypothetical protein
VKIESFFFQIDLIPNHRRHAVRFFDRDRALLNADEDFNTVAKVPGGIKRANFPIPKARDLVSRAGCFLAPQRQKVLRALDWCGDFL